MATPSVIKRSSDFLAELTFDEALFYHPPRWVRPDGTYALSFASLPQAAGETETRYHSWWENKPCVEDESHDQYSEPKSAYGPGISAAGKRDPKKPEVLSGQYEVMETGGYTVTVT